jgi:hypothetical protein
LLTLVGTGILFVVTVVALQEAAIAFRVTGTPAAGVLVCTSRGYEVAEAETGAPV